MVEIGLLDADAGDCILISYGEDKKSHILVDGGDSNMGSIVKELIEEIHEKNEMIEAIILTHIDNDHINGVLSALQLCEESVLSETIDRIYFNTSKGIERALHLSKKSTELIEESIVVKTESCAYGVGEAVSIMTLLEEKKLTNRLIDYVVMGETIKFENGAILKVISPGEKELKKLYYKWEKHESMEQSAYATNSENIRRNIDELQKEKWGVDTSVNNASSIAFLFEYKEIKLALLADSKPAVCLKGMKKFGTEKYQPNLLKIAHHGSNGNTSKKLLDAFETSKYLLSTNGHGGKVPSKVLISHLLEIKGNVEIYCNNSWWSNVYNNRYLTPKDQEKYEKSGFLKLVELTDEKVSIREGLSLYGEK